MASSPLMTTGLSGPTRTTSGVPDMDRPSWNRLSWSRLSWNRLPSNKHGDRRFQIVLDSGEKLRSGRAIKHAMIARQRDGEDACKRNPAVGFFDRLPPRRADRKDGGVRRIDDRGKFAHAIHAEIGDRRGAALIVGGLELFVAGARRQVFHLGGNGAD